MRIKMLVDVVTQYGTVLRADTEHDVDDRTGIEHCKLGRAIETPQEVERADGVPQRPGRRSKERSNA